MQHRSVIVPSLVTIFLCTFLLAGSLTISLGVLHLGENRSQLYRVEAFLPVAKIDSSKVEQIRRVLLTMREVEFATFRSQEQALEEFRQLHGSDMLEGLEGNPLPASYMIGLHKTGQSPQDLERVVTVLRQKGLFEEVHSSLQWVRILERWRLDLLFWPLLISALLAVTLAMIIGNAVRLTLYSRRILVENMKYAGGSSFFIQFPFVLEGFMQGLVGALGGAILFALGFFTISSLFPALDFMGSALLLYLPLMVLLCAVLGAYASLRAVRAFLLGEC